MSCFKSLFFVAGFAALVAADAGAVQPLLAPGDPILAIDFDIGSNSNYPIAESPFNAIDGNVNSKYLNFGQRNSGFIITPAFGATQVQSFLLTTANDAPARDPAQWALYGTNEPIVSLDNSDGMGENWTLVDSGMVMMPEERFTPGPLVTVNNPNTYASYRMVFTEVKDKFGANSMQVAEVAFHQTTDASDANYLGIFDDIRAVHLPTPESRYPGAESPPNAIDGDVNTKYLNFGKENSGFIVTPSVGASTVTGFQITTANDAPLRDPSSWILFGTNEPIVSADDSDGMGENWTMIAEGALTLPAERFTLGEMVEFANDAEFTSYRLVFPTVKDPLAAGVDSMQIAEIQFFGEVDMVLTPMPDLNMDGKVDIFDVAIVSNNWANTGTPGTVAGDANKDGTVDIFDVALISNNWNPGSASAVPEPSTLSILACAFVAMCLGGRVVRSARQR